MKKKKTKVSKKQKNDNPKCNNTKDNLLPIIPLTDLVSKLSISGESYNIHNTKNEKTENLK
jgi:hypothetical protein